MLDVALMNYEIALFDSIDFEPDAEVLGAQRLAENGELAGILAASVLDRQGVPEHRLDYLNNPAHGSGDRSVMEMFADDGLAGDALHRDQRFLKYLRYLLCGPHLPLPVIDGFRAEVAARTADGAIDSRRVVLKVRELARKSEKPSQRAEDFYMLALECRLDPALASDIRRTVARMK